MTGMEPGEDVVWIAENQDAQDPLLLTGRFCGHLDRGNAIADEFDDLSADEAIAWGRARSTVVLIRTGDGDYHSAGERNPAPRRVRRLAATRAAALTAAPTRVRGPRQLGARPARSLGCPRGGSPPPRRYGSAALPRGDSRASGAVGRPGSSARVCTGL